MIFVSLDAACLHPGEYPVGNHAGRAKLIIDEEFITRQALLWIFGMPHEEHIDVADFAQGRERCNVYVFMLVLVMIKGNRSPQT